VSLLALSYLTSCHQGLFEPKAFIRGTARTGTPEWFVANPQGGPFPCKHNNLATAQQQWPINQKVFLPGETFDLVWPRNNHIGGFVAVTLVPFDQSANKAEVENPKNVIMYACADMGCKGSPQYNNFNGEQFCSQQQAGNCVTCSLKVTIPSHVPTGTYTVQWRLFGHFDSLGIPNRSLMDYATCVDLRIQNPNPSPRPACPIMVGDNCEHFKGVTDINQMLNGEREVGSRNDRSSFVERGIPIKVQQCKANAPQPTPAPTPKPVTQATPAPTPATTSTNTGSLAHLTAQVDRLEKQMTSLLQLVRQIHTAVQPKERKKRK
jgi:hypothetical protein